MTERTPMTAQEEHTASREGHVFRSVIGIMAMLTAIGGFGLLFFFEIPARNENAIMFALGAVFGWAGSVIASEYGASNTGRKVAESAIRKFNEPVQDVSVVNPPSDPVPVKGK